ncbi:MAG: CotH kinase family protein [Phycisphaerales bacterium]|nr:MAG: CotH kinase family protein [Phycisphaerales bacterium]
MIGTWKSVSLTVAVALALLATTGTRAAVIINELHTNPDVETELVEFIELHNDGATDVDLSGWRLSEGVFHTFREGFVLPAGGFAVVAQDLNELYAKWGILGANLPAVRVTGQYGGKLRSEGEKVVLCDATGAVVDEVNYGLGFPWPTVGDPVPEGRPGSGHSLQLLGPQFDNDLGGSWRSATPTPGFPNIEVLADNIPPCIRQVDHSPREPKSGEPVAITAKITDPEGVRTVLLSYQVVAPGRYVALDDPEYENDWTTVAMHDDGLEGDAEARDDIYTVQLSASVQEHRSLVRYRIYAMDGSRMSVTVPYADDPQPNFAYFVYDGVPAYRGAVQPGVTQEIVFPSSVMASLPVYHLISKKSEVEECTWFSKYGGSDYRWQGTLVYEGHVCDHIRYRARGGVWRYAMGKNMWKFDFNRGQGFQARDDYGNKYDTTWDKLNFSACIQQGSFGQRGEQGMFEALSFRLFNMVGVPASKTNYVHFRIIDEVYGDGTRNAAHSPMTTSGTQYDGDFWGLYMTIEQMDGRFLDEHGLPDGNLFKIDNSNHETNNQGPTQPSDQSDLDAFLSRVSGASESWWQANANLDVYYGYYAIYQAVHHGDITGKNWFLYHHPETDRWWQLPWDVDLTWTTYYGSNDPSDPWSRAGLLSRPTLSMQNKNRLREINDLLWNTDQTGQLIDEFAAIIDDPAGGLSMVDADRAMWDYHWVVGNGAYPRYINREASHKAGQGRFYAAAAGTPQGRTFEGMVQVMRITWPSVSATWPAKPPTRQFPRRR